jgi:hypothetical protein
MKTFRDGLLRKQLLNVFAFTVVSLSLLLPGVTKAAQVPGTIYLPTIHGGDQEPALTETPDTSGAGEEVIPPGTTALAIDSATIWRADFDSGSYPGTVAISGNAIVALSTKQVHAGRYSAALTIINADGLQKPEPGVRMEYNAKGAPNPTDPKNIPDVAYYSAYYYFPQNVISEWWNVMQWKQAMIESNGNQTRIPVYSIHPLYQNGNMSFYLRSRVDASGNYRDPAVIIAGSTRAVPLKKWVLLECMYRWSKLADGQITCWMDGQLLWDVKNIITEFDIPYRQYPRQWTVNNYAGMTLPTTHVLYVDDMAVRTKSISTP